MTINLADNNPRIAYTVAQGATQQTFAVPFEFFNDPDISVYVDGVLKTQGTHYTLTGGDGSTGNVVFVTATPPAVQQVLGATGGSRVVIFRATPLERTSDFSAGADINRAALNEQLDILTAMIADEDDRIDRSITLNPYDLGATLTLPTNRANRCLAFDANGNVTNGPIVTYVTDAEGYATSAAASAATASEYTPAYFDNFAALKADTDTWPTNQILNTRTEGFAYKVAASGATDHHITTAGGVKLYVQPNDSGYNVKAFGAVGDGTTNDTAAFLAAALAAGASNPIYVPSGLYSKTTIANEDTYFWICGEAFNASGTNPISLLGHVEQALNNRRLISKTASSANEFAEVQLIKTFNYTGGTSGNVSSNLHLTTAVSQNVTNFVWGITSVLNNSADAGENVAIYGQGNRDAGVGPIWGGVFEAKDKTNTSGVGKGGTVGLEVDIFANDVVAGSLNRVGVDVVGGKGDSTGATCQVGYGVRVGPQGGSVSNATFLIGYSATGTTTADFSAGSAGTQAGFNVVGSPTSGVRISGTCAVGLNTSLGTITGNAVRLASTQNIAMEATGIIKTSWGVTANIWGFYNDTTERFGINTTTGVLRVNGTQVIAARQTGWAAPTGTATRTTFATSTVTTAHLAERVKALIDDLTTHGLIGA